MKKNDHYIPFCRPCLSKEDVDEVVNTLKSVWIGTGPKTKEFADLFRSYVGTKYAVCLNSCTAALHLALLAAGVSKGDEVITTPMTFAATANVIEHVGAQPVFVDVFTRNLNINVDLIEKKISRKTKVILPVHFAGHPASLDEIHKLAKKYNLIVVEDAAHAIEAVYRGRKIGGISDFTAFSFYVTKNITTAEGGMITTSNKVMAEKIEIMSLHGMSKDAWKRYTHRGIVNNFEIVLPGFKYNMFDVQAAIGINQLRNINALYERRKYLYRRYRELLNNIPYLDLLHEDEDVVHSYHLFIVLLKLEELTISRDELRSFLEAYNIGSGVHYIALHRHPFYSNKYGYKANDFPVANRASERTLSLPLYINLTDEEQNYIVDVLLYAFKKYSKR